MNRGIALLLMALSTVPLFAQQDASARFEVASVKRHTSGAADHGIRVQGGGRYAWTNSSLKQLMASAYASRDSAFREIVNGPDWIDSARWDVVAKTEEGARVVDPDGLPTPLFAMLRNLLEDRFHLRVHRESRVRPIYALVLSPRHGKQLSMARSDVDCAAVARDRAAANPVARRPTGMPPCALRVTTGHVEGAAIAMGQLAGALSSIAERPVQDQTGLSGVFDVTLDFSPDFQGGVAAPATGPPASADAPSVFTALQEQLGLELKPTRRAVDVLVIDHAEQPAGD